MNVEGDTPLHVACKLKNTAAVQLLGEKERCDLNTYDKKGDTALHIAIQMGKSKMLEILVKNGADILRPDRHGNAPIHIACLNFRLDILRNLLSGNPNQQNEDGDTALHIVCRMIISLESKLNTSVYACMVLILKFYNEHCAPFEETDKDVLHNVCAEGQSDMVQLLIENGADVLRPNRSGRVPLHIACSYTFQIALNCECCDPNQKNGCGDTALHIVCRMRIELLFMVGIHHDVQQSDTNENAPIHIANTPDLI